MTRIIPLTRGYFTCVSDCDYEWAAQYRWRADSSLYVVRDCYDPRTQKSSIRFMHREILGADKGDQVDHVDGNKLNNTRKNLRLCDFSGNVANRPKRSDAFWSEYKGVSWSPRLQVWQAKCSWRGTIYRLGQFEDELAAAVAYDLKASAVHGSFARLNFPNGVLLNDSFVLPSELHRLTEFVEFHRSRKRARKSQSGVAGVSWNKHKKKWLAYGSKKGKTLRLGRFSELQDAIEARKRWCEEQGIPMRSYE